MVNPLAVYHRHPCSRRFSYSRHSADRTPTPSAIGVSIERDFDGRCCANSAPPCVRLALVVENGRRRHFGEPERQEAVRARVVVAVLSASMFPDRRTRRYDNVVSASCPLQYTHSCLNSSLFCPTAPPPSATDMVLASKCLYNVSNPWSYIRGEGKCYSHHLDVYKDTPGADLMANDIVFTFQVRMC